MTGTAVAAMLLLAGCFHEMHEIRPSEYPGDTPVGYLAATVEWLQESDAETPVRNITYALAGPGLSQSQSFASEEDAARWLQQLPVGEYDLLVTVNLTEADGYLVSGMPATKAETGLGDVTVRLKEDIKEILQAWSGQTHVTITEGDITVAAAQLRGLLATLSVSVKNVPDGVQIGLTVSDIAQLVNLSEKDGKGYFGRPGPEVSPDKDLGTLVNGGNGTRLLPDCELFPTADGYDRCHLTLTITTADGKTLTCVCDAPRMDSGVYYLLELDYNTLQSYMQLGSYAIGAWEDGWTISGIVLNPQE